MISPGVLVRTRARQPLVRTVPAPVRGWNARDSVDQFEEDEASLLDNFFPGFGDVSLRGGHTEHATSVGSGDVETLASYEAGSVLKMLAAASGNIYDATSAGAASSLATGFANDRWQWANFNGSMGLVNGADAPQEYNGSTVAAMTVSGTGLTVSNLVGINVFKSRTYFWENDSQDFWYSAVNALGGALTKFPLSRVGQFGGNLVTMGTITRDGGAGLDDLAAFVMSSGQVIIYAGSDPGSSTDWSLVGVFNVGAPVNIRGIAKVAGDLVVTTQDGYVSLEGAISRARSGTQGIVSDRIRSAVLSQVSSQGTNFGWQTAFYPRGNFLLFNYPTGTSGQFQQHIVNTATGAWARFKGLNGRSWVVHNDRLYFGGNAKTFLADNGFNDDGADILAEGKTAFTYLGSRKDLKRLTAVRPLMSSDGSLPLSVSVDANFRDGPFPTNSVEFGTGGAGGVWDSSPWDATAWGTGAVIREKWLVRSALGYNFAMKVRFASKNQSVKWLSQTYVYEPGGVL